MEEQHSASSEPMVDVLAGAYRGVASEEEEEMALPPRRSLRRVLSVFVLLVVLGALLLGGVWAFLVLAPADSRGEEREFTIEPGTRLPDILLALQREGFVRSGYALGLLLRFQEKETAVKAGTFLLSPAMTPRRIAEVLTAQAPPERDVTVTIPEGFTIAQIAEALAEAGVIADADAFRQSTVRIAPYEFLEACSAAVGTERCVLPVALLEGFFFPDTYRFRKGSSANDIAEKFLVNFGEKFTPALRQEVSEKGQRIADVVTLASLVEEEARSDADRALIAGVFAKRLEIGMPLQVDATVLYAKEQAAGEPLHDRTLTLADLRLDSLYNTYLYPGLPPGPIANPGLKSLIAAIRPEPSPYLFYLHTPEGETIFSRTLAEHNAAKARYLR